MPAPRMIRPEQMNEGAGQLERIDSERGGQMAEMLGLHPEFVDDVRERGQEAVIERVEETDPSGLTAKLLRLVQQVATWMEQRMATGRPPEQRELQGATARLAQKYGLEVEPAVELMMAVLQKYQEAIEEMGGAAGGERQGGPDASR